MPLIGIFFYVEGKLLTCTTELDKADSYGDFLVSPFSHDSAWNNHFKKGTDVDFDYYPRGRLIYSRSKNEYIIYIDKCLDSPEIIVDIRQSFQLDNVKCTVSFDEHYQCHMCNEFYVS